MKDSMTTNKVAPKTPVTITRAAVAAFLLAAGAGATHSQPLNMIIAPPDKPGSSFKVLAHVTDAEQGQDAEPSTSAEEPGNPFEDAVENIDVSLVESSLLAFLSGGGIEQAPSDPLEAVQHREALLAMNTRLRAWLEATEPSGA